MIYDCRKPGIREQGSVCFPCPVVIVDAGTGERIPNVFWASTNPASLRRFITDANGSPMVAADGVSRLEVEERRAWQAVTLDGASVVAQSE